MDVFDWMRWKSLCGIYRKHLLIIIDQNYANRVEELTKQYKIIGMGEVKDYLNNVKDGLFWYLDTFHVFNDQITFPFFIH